MTGKGPNILLLVVDCLRADVLLGDCKAVVPTLTSVVEEGTVFTKAFSATSTTTPNFASILTGRFSFDHGIRTHTGFKLSSKVATMGELLQKAGYRTVAEVTGPLYTETGLTRGFDEYNYRERKRHIYTDWGKELVERMDGLKGQAPWFLLLHLWALHTPRQVLPEFEKGKYGANRYVRAVSCLDAHLGPILDAVGEDDIVVVIGDHGELALTDAQRKVIRMKELYHGARARLKMSYKEKNWPDTHGFHVYDFLIHIPLVFSGKAFPSGKRLDKLVRQVDVFPTALRTAGLELPEASDRPPDAVGQDLMPMMQGRKARDMAAYIEECQGNLPVKERWMVGMRTSSKKYIFSPYNDERDGEIYDLGKDPQEKRNLASGDPDADDGIRERIMERFGSRAVTFELPGEKMSEKEEEDIRDRLRALGYLD
jgi:arylsulfatase A-like enzyme